MNPSAFAGAEACHHAGRRKARQAHDGGSRRDAHAALEPRVEVIEADALASLGDLRDQGMPLELRFRTPRELGCQVAIALGPGHDARGVGIGRDAVARRKVVQAGPGGDLRGDGAVIVAAAVIRVPGQTRGIPALTAQILGKADQVEAAPFGVGGAVLHGNGENRPAVPAGRVLHALRRGEERRELCLIANRGAHRRDEAFLPAAIHPEPLLRIRRQPVFVVHGTIVLPQVQDDPQLGEQI